MVTGIPDAFLWGVLAGQALNVSLALGLFWGMRYLLRRTKRRQASQETVQA